MSSSWSFAAVQNPQNGSVGLQGKISAPPPTQGATISFPTNGTTFNKLPINVTGICPTGVLVKLFKNNVFSGSAQCSSGNYSITADLFNDKNELVARVFDALDQAGPDSNTVTVTYTDTSGATGPRVSVTSNYAKRGAEPGKQLSWPITVSGGAAPYALSVDWGDKSSADVISRQFGGEFNIAHSYSASGIYNVIVKVTDKDGSSSFLQLVGVGNGPIVQDAATSSSTPATNTPAAAAKQVILWWPIALLVALTLVSFWLGRRHQKLQIRRKILSGDRPF